MRLTCIRTPAHGAFALAAALALAACDRAPSTPSTPAAASPPPPMTAPTPSASTPAASAAAPAPPAGAGAPAADAWLGRWTGPEGTFLDLAREGDGYRLVLQNLDGPTTYAARAVDGGLAFERAGQAETVRATDGAATGMKWLMDKKNCLTVRSGEGYCRD